MGKEIKFRPATFYLGIVDMLAREVEGQKDEEGEGAEESGDRREDQRREQMVHSLEGAGAEVKVSDKGRSVGTKSAEGSKSTSGSATPRANSLLNEHTPAQPGSSASATTTSTVGLTRGVEPEPGSKKKGES